MPDLNLERDCPGALVCGVDEVGRGPWAGPVVAAAVILDPNSMPDGLDDSKRLSRARREALHDLLTHNAHVGIGEASVIEIDQINILQASLLAMERAVAALPVRPDFALIDGRHCPRALACESQAVIKGDSRSASIAAASIVAKVTRDRMMVALAQQFPGYGWETNAGYGTKAHSHGLQRCGVTPHHRRSFKPIHNILCEEN